MVLLLYCIRLPRAADAGSGGATTGLECRGPGRRRLRASVRRRAGARVRRCGDGPPGVTLGPPLAGCTGPRSPGEPAVGCGGAAPMMMEVEIVVGWSRQASGRAYGRQGRYATTRRHPCGGLARVPAPRDRSTDRENDIVPMVSANGNKPITPLSDAAEPHCVSVKDCSWGGGSHLVIPPEPLPDPSGAATRSSCSSAELPIGNRPSRRLREA